jgi:hypothetical protein
VTGKKWHRFGAGLLASGALLMLGGCLLGYRYLVGLPLPTLFDAWLEQAATSTGRLGGVVILCGPGIIVGLIGYAIMEKFEDYE